MVLLLQKGKWRRLEVDDDCQKTTIGWRDERGGVVDKALKDKLTALISRVR